MELNGAVRQTVGVLAQRAKLNLPQTRLAAHLGHFYGLGVSRQLDPEQPT